VSLTVLQTVWDTDQPGDVILRTEITEGTGHVRSVTSYRIQNMGDTVHEGIFIRCIKSLSVVCAWRNFVGVLRDALCRACVEEGWS
jgi:hypothetical protein